MSLTFSLTIGGIEYISWTDPATIRPVDSIKDRSDTLSELVINLPYTGNTPASGAGNIPRSGQEIILTRGTGSGAVREFGGVVQKVTERWGRNGTLQYTLQCGDYTRWFDRYQVQGVRYASMAAGVMVRQIVADWCNKGTITWDVSLVENGPTIPDQTFDFVQPAQALDIIAKLAGYRWDVDYYRRVVFTNSDTNVAPLPEITDDTLEIGDLEFEDAADQVVNVVYIKDAKVPSGQQIEPFKADGIQTFFPLGFEPADMATTSVSYKGTTYSVANGNLLEENVATKPGDGKSGDWFALCLPNWGLRYGGVAPPTDAPITATYNYLDIGPAVYRVDDPESIAAMAAREGTTGEYEDVLSMGELINVSSDAIRARAQIACLQRRPKYLGSFVVMNTTGWRSGQYFTYRGDKRMGGLFSFGKHFYVMSVQKSLVNQDTMAALVSFASDLYGEM